jgi:soluble lytic murein transglycosylase-like protein
MGNLNYSAIVEPAAALYAIPAPWVYAVIGAESGDVKTFAYRDVGATWEPVAGEFSWGPMQILESTARQMGFTGATPDLNRPEISIPLGVKYLRWILDHKDATTFAELYSAYNSGKPAAYRTPGAVQNNVKRALVWLAHFRPKGAAAVVALLALGLGFWIQKRRR